jgi:hypothetical protein
VQFTDRNSYSRRKKMILSAQDTNMVLIHDLRINAAEKFETQHRVSKTEMVATIGNIVFNNPMEKNVVTIYRPEDSPVEFVNLQKPTIMNLARQAVRHNGGIEIEW